MNWLHALNNDWVKSTAALLIGWFLNALTPYFAERRERRKAISRALADLIEVHEQLLTIEIAMGELNKVTAIPPEIEIQLRVFFSQLFLPRLQEMSQRYNESVTVVTSLDPLLGSDLRLKGSGQPLLNTLNQFVAQMQDTQAAILWKQINTMILTKADESLTSLIKRLAMKRSFWTRLQVTQRIALSRKLPKEADALIELLKTEIEKHKQPNSPDGPPTK